MEVGQFAANIKVNIVKLQLNEDIDETVIFENAPNLLVAFHYYKTAKRDLKKSLPKNMRSCNLIVLEIVSEHSGSYLLEPKTYSDLWNFVNSLY